MYGCCLYSSRGSSFSVIDHLPTSRFSSSSLHFSLKFNPIPPTPPPIHTKCDTLVFAACPSAPLISSSFLAPSIPLLHQVPTLQPDLSHLGSHREVTAGRKCTVSQSGRPSAAAVTPREKVKAADNGRGEKKHITSFAIPTWGREIKHPPVWFRRVIGRVRSKLQRYINQISDNQFLLV